MASFSDLFPDEIIMDSLGDDITYIYKNGGSISIKAVVEFDVERVGGDGYTIERRTEVEFLKSVINGAPSRGDSIMYDKQNFVVETVINENDAYFRVVVKS